MTDYRSLVIGGNHQNTLGVIEALGRKGINSYAIINDVRTSSFVLKSKYVKKGWICNEDSDVINCIVQNFDDNKGNIVVTACCDNMASLLNDHYEQFSSFLLLPGISEQGSLTKWMDKEKMNEVARSLGLCVPRSWIVTSKLIPEDIVFPCVTKSLSSIKNGKSEFTLCHNKEELITFLERQAHSTSIQVQEYIDKEFEFQYLGCSIDNGKTIIIPGRTHIGETTHFNNITFLKYQKERIISDSTTLSKAEAFVRKTYYSGLFSVEFMHGKDGIDYFLEMNFRNDGNGIAVTASGTNLPYIWYLSCCGKCVENELAKSKVNDTYMMPEDSYFLSMLEENISFNEWRKHLNKTTCFLTYYKGNTKPFWSLMWLQKKAFLLALGHRVLRLLRIERKK